MANIASTSAACYYETWAYTLPATTSGVQFTIPTGTQNFLLHSCYVTNTSTVNCEFIVYIYDGNLYTNQYIYYGVIPAKTQMVVISRDAPIILSATTQTLIFAPNDYTSPATFSIVLSYLNIPS